MDRAKVILVVLNKKFLRNALTILNYKRVVPFVVLMDGKENFITINKKIKLQVVPFASLNQIVDLGRNFLWLICGRGNDKNSPAKLKKFLAANDVPENNIVNFEFMEQINPAWLANLRYVEENPVDCFATGNSLTEYGLDFKNIQS